MARQALNEKPIAKIKKIQGEPKLVITIDNPNQYLDQDQLNDQVDLLNCFQSSELLFLLLRYFEMESSLYEGREAINDFFKIREANLLAAIKSMLINDPQEIVEALLNNNRFFESD